MLEYKIIEIGEQDLDSIQKLADEQNLENDSTFVQRTVDEWKNGINTFSKPGEKFWGIVVDNEIVGIGGINQDPFTDDTTLGRVRHVYIAKKYRRQGLARVLLNKIILHARSHFKYLRLATKNPVAALLYESLGFVKDDSKTPRDVREKYPDRHTYYLYW